MIQILRQAYSSEKNNLPFDFHKNIIYIVRRFSALYPKEDIECLQERKILTNC